MKKYLTIPLLAVVGGVGCFLLRFLQNRSGFEPDTGLPVPGEPFGILLPAALLLLAAAVLFLGKQLPNEKEDSPLDFHENFSGNTSPLAATVCGAFLWILSGAAGLAAILTGGGSMNASSVPGLYIPADPASQRLDLLLYALTVLAGICLLPAAIAARRGEKLGISSAMTGNLILFPVVYLVLRLALSYREMSINSSQQVYYVELFALMFLILSLFRLSSFAFRCGKTRRFVLFSAMAVILCIAALADAASLSDRLFFAGGAALLLGFLLQRLFALAPAS